MIREMKEPDLQDAPKREIAEMVRAAASWRASEADISKAIDEIDRIRRMAPGIRAIIARYLGTDELFCHLCGETSCIHGYSDE